MANTLDGFVVVEVGGQPFTLTPKDVGSALQRRSALTNLRVEYIADSFETAFGIGTIGEAEHALTSALNLAASAAGTDPLSHISTAIQEISKLVPSGVLLDLQAVKTAVQNIQVKLTRLTMDFSGGQKNFSIGMALDLEGLFPANFPFKIKVLAVTFERTGA